jgi:hypothetical protein
MTNVTRLEFLQAYIKTRPDFLSLSLELVTVLLVHYNLDVLYLEDRDKAAQLLLQKMKNEEIPFLKRAVTVTDFEDDYNNILKKIENVHDDKDEEMLMLLVYMSRFFEMVVNEHIHFELEYKKFTGSEIKQILRKFSINEKLGWFLKILSGKDYTNEKSNSWSVLSNLITTRNFYIHYEPVTMDVFDTHVMKLSKDSFRSFMESTRDCYHFLNECKNKGAKDKDERIYNLRNYIKNQAINPSKYDV